jgi:hypothetical protein
MIDSELFLPLKFGYFISLLFSCEWNFDQNRTRLILSALASGKTPENEPESGGDLAEDVDEFFPEVFVHESVKKRVEASGAHAGQVTHGIDAKHAVDN